MTVPLIQFDLSDFEAAVQDKIKRTETAIDRVANSLLVDANTDLQTATQKFSDPLSTAIHRKSLGNYDLLCGDKRFLWLDKGTKEHSIDAHSALGMSFPWASNRKRGQHIPKTSRSLKPGAGSGDTYKSGSSWVSRVMHVDHPGIKPRNWSGILLRKYRKEAVGRVIRALRNV